MDDTPRPPCFCSKFFPSWTIKHQHLAFSSVAVCLFLARILWQVLWWSVTLLTRYDIISSRCSSHFWNACSIFYVFQDKKNKKDKSLWLKWSKVSTYLCIIVHVKHKKIPILCIFTWYSFWVKSRMPAGPTPIKFYIPLSCREDQRLSTEGIKSFWNTATYQKLEGGFITAPSLPCTTVRVWLRVRPRFKCIRVIKKVSS